MQASAFGQVALSKFPRIMYAKRDLQNNGVLDIRTETRLSISVPLRTLIGISRRTFITTISNCMETQRAVLATGAFTLQSASHYDLD